MNVIGELVKSQAGSFVIAVAVGIALFFIYDWFRIFRRILPHNLAAIAIEDIGYWMFWTISVFYLLNQIDHGMLRGFTMGGIGLGMIGYYFIFSKSVIHVCVWTMQKLLWLIRKLTWVVLFPLRQLAKVLRPPGRYIKQRAAKLLRNLKKRLQNSVHTIKMGLCKL